MPSIFMLHKIFLMQKYFAKLCRTNKGILFTKKLDTLWTNRLLAINEINLFIICTGKSKVNYKPLKVYIKFSILGLNNLINLIIQAFSSGNVFGLQFHVEQTNETVPQWDCVPEYKSALKKTLGSNALEKFRKEVEVNLKLFVQVLLHWHIHSFRYSDFSG